MNIEFLDGYLGGISALDGAIRQYLACAFMTSFNRGDVVEDVRIFYSPDFQLQCSAAEIMPGGLKELEKEMQSYLIQNLLGYHLQFDAKSIEERRRYLAFRVMDFLCELLGSDVRESKVYKFEAYLNNICYKFFSVSCKNKVLHLQFSEIYKEEPLKNKLE
ncbi:hypothetical protein HDN1F_36970 [gamma proteobacterium HdN1]|nr:hypothetical protein HDN1F_36970 [gamma proteobacterium HdN1]